MSFAVEDLRRETGDFRLVEFHNGERQSDGDDMGADLSVFLVGDAGAFGFDAAAGIEFELDGHGPSARLFDLAGDHERVVVILHVGNVA